ncbi:MAG: CdvA-like protein [Desulfurococcales archaeon]|nr:CdvA-like protein [Desulfurococcales archaeon]
MAPRLEEVAPLVGGDVFDEYGRVIGVLVSFSSNVNGIIEYVEVKYTDRGLERIEGDRLRIEQGRLVVTPPWKHRAVKIIEALDRAYRRRNALEQITAGDLPAEIVEGMKRKIEDEIKRLKVKADESMAEIRERLGKLDDELTHVASAIAFLQMSYFSGELGDRNFEHGMSHLRKLKQSLISEKEDAKRVMEKLDKTLKALTSPAAKITHAPKHKTVEPERVVQPSVPAKDSGILSVKVED